MKKENKQLDETLPLNGAFLISRTPHTELIFGFTGRAGSQRPHGKTGFPPCSPFQAAKSCHEDIEVLGPLLTSSPRSSHGSICGSPGARPGGQTSSPGSPGPVSSAGAWTPWQQTQSLCSRPAAPPAAPTPPRGAAQARARRRSGGELGAEPEHSVGSVAGLEEAGHRAGPSRGLRTVALTRWHLAVPNPTPGRGGLEGGAPASEASVRGGPHRSASLGRGEAPILED